MIQIIEDEWFRLSVRFIEGEWFKLSVRSFIRFIEDEWFRLLKMNDSDYPRDLLKVNNSNCWRWMIQIVEEEWLRFIDNEWFGLSIKFIEMNG
jgi:hypothetical protein